MRIPSSLLVAAVLIGLASPSAADPVGLVQKLQNTAYGTPPQAARMPKQPTDGVEFNELIETVPRSAIEIGFIDGSSLTLGADASVLIDEFVFDSASGSGNAVIGIGKGAVRWATGVMPPQNVVIETPTASIAIRGTLLKIGVKPNGDSIIALLRGLVNVRSINSGQSADLNPGQTALVTRDGVEVVDQVLSVADAIVDDGWSRAEDFSTGRRGRGRDSSGSGGSGSGNNSNDY
ncbi:FecR family protein [Dongia mobilis]|uniref:FecR family protein n=1 Tax=Dongia mobilis TaxID=578943 RepID=A0A4R6WRG3_9PROT|nr:FecR domain-containing protein [Dongia mobilis]TDQ84192.1 FecR family protein [Dongia mobilis]